MNSNIGDMPKNPGSHWNKPGNRRGQALETFWESQRELDDKLRNRFSKKHPDLSYHEVEALVAMKILEMCETEPDTFFAALCGDSAQETGTPQPADAIDPTLLAFLVQWRM
jgi:hypothetical protein